jgi:TPP-dependent 2-oxoacid decarboxylase
MLPYEDIWELIMKIIKDSPAIATSRKYESYDEELYEELSNKAVEYFFSTADHVEYLNYLLQDIDSVDFTYRYKSDESIKLKLERINMKKQLYKIANDIWYEVCYCSYYRRIDKSR